MHKITVNIRFPEIQSNFSKFYEVREWTAYLRINIIIQENAIARKIFKIQSTTEYLLKVIAGHCYKINLIFIAFTYYTCVFFVCVCDLWFKNYIFSNIKYNVDTKIRNIYKMFWNKWRVMKFYMLSVKIILTLL